LFKTVPLSTQLPFRIIKNIVLLAVILSGFSALGLDAAYAQNDTTDSIPLMLMGKFTDDYGIRYEINDSLWVQQPDIHYRVLRWNKDEQYHLAS
jgi:hypothetical protein